MIAINGFLHNLLKFQVFMALPKSLAINLLDNQGVMSIMRCSALLMNPQRIVKNLIFLAHSEAGLRGGATRPGRIRRNQLQEHGAGLYPALAHKLHLRPYPFSTKAWPAVKEGGLGLVWEHSGILIFLCIENEVKGKRNGEINPNPRRGSAPRGNRIP